MKYVMLETREGGKYAVIFPDMFTHAVVAEFMKIMLSRVHHVESAPSSAGFIALGEDVTTFGESESLGGMKANEVDALRIMAGESVSHMPDALLAPLMEKLKGHVRLPQSVEEAQGMLLVAEAYLKERAPDQVERALTCKD